MARLVKILLESFRDSSDGFATKKPRLREALLYPPASLRACLATTRSEAQATTGRLRPMDRDKVG
jgi:hypothetical protein